jgi:mRNA-degrading endonuclease RelE of RelBE toxin-antitoxin system
MTVRLHSDAEAELTQAVSWYDRVSRELGDRFIHNFRRAIDQILAFPNAWPKASRRSRKIRLRGFPYGIIYQIREDTIVVIAVAQLNRKPRYWRDRET